MMHNSIEISFTFHHLGFGLKIKSPVLNRTQSIETKINHPDLAIGVVHKHYPRTAIPDVLHGYRPDAFFQSISIDPRCHPIHSSNYIAYRCMKILTGIGINPGLIRIIRRCLIDNILTHFCIDPETWQRAARTTG